MIILADLFVMQYDLRHTDQLREMTAHVRFGGYWTPEYLALYAREKGFKPSPLIQISRFEDGLLYVHDGHHRCVSTILGGRDHLILDEFNINEWKYEQYLEVNHAAGWYTPFDPRLHLRSGDFTAFKKEARGRFLVQPPLAEAWVRAHVGRFRRDRTFGTVPEMAESISKEK